MLRLTVVVTLMNACTLFAWWGFNLWLPATCRCRPPGRHRPEPGDDAGFVVAMQVGMWFGYVTFGFVSDASAGSRTYVTYLLAAAALLLIYVSVRSPLAAARARPVRRVLRHRLLSAASAR